MKKILFLTSLLMLAACTEEASVREPEQEEITTPPISAEPTYYAGDGFHHDRHSEGKEASIEYILAILENAYDGTADIQYYDGAFTVTPDMDFGRAVYEIMEGNMPKDKWYDVLETFSAFSIDIATIVGPQFGLKLGNPANPTNTLAVFLNGEVLYDVLAEY